MKKKINVYLYKESRLETSYRDISALHNNKQYIFIIDGIKTTISCDFFIRENDEYKFILDIKKKTATYLLKEKNLLFDIEVKKINYQSSSKNIIIEYKIETADENIKIELKEKDD